MKSEMGVNRMTESVFSERVRALQGPLWRIAWAILRNGADCDDAIQETLLRAWNRIGSLRDETAFDAWLMRILVNECKDILRRRARRPQTSMEAAPELAAPVENTALRDAIFALPDAAPAGDDGSLETARRTQENTGRMELTGG